MGRETKRLDEVRKAIQYPNDGGGLAVGGSILTR